jgi:hypothetical protein
MHANLIVKKEHSSPPFRWVNSYVSMDSVVPRNATRFIANEHYSSTYEVGGGLLLETGYLRNPFVDTMAVQLKDRLIIDASSEVLSFRRENASLSERPWVYDTTRDQWLRLKTHNFSEITTWRINSTRVFCAWSHISRAAGHMVREIFTMMGIFLRTYGNVTSGDIAIAVMDPANLDFDKHPMFSAELVYWIFKYINVKVVFLPRYTPIYADTLIFSRTEDSMNDFALSFVRDVLWPNVQTEYASYPTYERVALIKPAKAGGTKVGTGRGFEMSDRFIALLKAAGYFVITLDIPSAERMWYINHAKRVILTAGSQKDVLLWLRAGNFSTMEGLFLVHSGYLWEFSHFKWRSCDNYNITILITSSAEHANSARSTFLDNPKIVVLAWLVSCWAKDELALTIDNNELRRLRWRICIGTVGLLFCVFFSIGFIYHEVAASASSTSSQDSSRQRG